MKCNINRKQFDAIPRNHRLEVAARLTALEFATLHPEVAEDYIKQGVSLREVATAKLNTYTNNEIDRMAAQTAQRLLDMGFTEADLADIVAL